MAAPPERLQGRRLHGVVGRPAATAVLSSLGADVIKVESVNRPDYMRFASARPPTEDQWWEWGALFHGANVDKRGITLDLTHPAGVETFERLAASADILVENYTPRVMEQFGLGWDRLHEVNPDLSWCGCRPSASTVRGGTGPGSPRPWSA